MPEAQLRLESELQQLGVTEYVISSNVRVRRDRTFRSGFPDDPGVSAFWTVDGQPLCMAVDCYDRPADNIAAIAATLRAMRAIARHGGAQLLERAFTGFIGLPAPREDQD